MPLVQNFSETSIWKAFFLNALASSLVIVLAITIREQLDRSVLKGSDGIIKDTPVVENVLTTFVLTFVASLATFVALRVLFGFGEGMLA